MKTTYKVCVTCSQEALGGIIIALQENGATLDNVMAVQEEAPAKKTRKGTSPWSAATPVCIDLDAKVPPGTELQHANVLKMRATEISTYQDCLDALAAEFNYKPLKTLVPARARLRAAGVIQKAAPAQQLALAQ